MKKANHSSRGFTLVELAIVMVIIGLLIGGILKGQSMIEDARVKSIIKQVNSYGTALNVFQDKYGALPGDLNSATSRVPACTTANVCVDGDGNGKIGATTANWSHDNQMGASALPEVETAMFWKHLILSDIISGIRPNGNPATPEWGITHPFVSGYGGFAVMHVQEAGGSYNSAAGHFVMMRPSVSGDPHPASGGGALTPSMAFQIDQKMDDGFSNTGYVRSDDASSRCAVPPTDGVPGAYSTDLDDMNCVTIFRLN